MRLTVLLVAGLLADLSIRPVAAAKPPALSVAKRLSLEARHQPPTFYAAEPMVLVDRGRKVFAGRGAARDPEAIELLDLATLALTRVKVPTYAFTTAHREAGVSPTVQGLLCYDTTDGWAGVLLYDKDLQPQTYSLAHWNLTTNALERISVIAARDRLSNWTAVRTIGYDPARRECLVAVVDARRGEAPSPPLPPAGQSGAAGRPARAVPQPASESFHIAVVAIGETVRTVASFTAARKPTHWPIWDAAQGLVGLAEYAELPEDGEARAHVVSLASGAVRSVPIPQVTYGLAFAPGGERLYAYSNLSGELLAIDLANGAVGKRLKLSKRGHALGLVAPETLVLVTPASLHFFDAQTLTEKGKVPTKKLEPSIMHVEGTVVIPGRILLRAFADLFVVDVGR